MEARHTSGEYSASPVAPQSIAPSCGHTWALIAHHGRQKDDPHAAQVPAEGSCLSHGGVLVFDPAAVAAMLVNMLELQCNYSRPGTIEVIACMRSIGILDEIAPNGEHDGAVIPQHRRRRDRSHRRARAAAE